MASATKFLDKRFKLSDGTYRVRIRVTHLRKSIYLNTKYSFEEKVYRNKIEKGLNMNASDSYFKAKKEITEMETKANQIINDLVDFSFDDFRTRFEQKGDRLDLIHLLNEQSEYLRKLDKFSNANIYLCAANLFRGYSQEKFNSESLHISKINPALLEDFQAWAITETPQKRGYSITTIGMCFVRVQKIFNNLIRSGELKKTLYPFGEGLFRIPQSINNKRPLGIDEIQQLFDYLPKSPAEDFAKSMFLFSYLCSGMNLADIFNLKHSSINDGRLTFIRQKTKGKGVEKTLTIKITPEIQSILDKHIVYSLKSKFLFKVYQDSMTPIERHRAKDAAILSINRNLKTIAKKIGLPQNISSYWARHSYSTILMESGAPVQYISKRLGHSTLATTEAYLGQFSKESEEKFEANLLKRNIK